MQHKEFIGPEIKVLSNLIKRRLDNSATFTEAHKLTGMHGWVIGYLYEHRDKGPMFQKDIEAEFSIRRSTATGILQLMERNGLLLRESVSYDARLKSIVLTPKAIKLHEAIVKEIKEMEALLVKGLTEEEIKTFLTIIRKIKSNIEN